jgi:hypothetical protein
MRNTNDTGFFSMALAHEVAAMKDLAAAKLLAHAAVHAREGAKPENIAKAHAVINSATSINKLVLNMGSFMMAHIGMPVLGRRK